MRIGNDIVDRDGERPPFHPRFPRRILADAEYIRYLVAPARDDFLWSAWAAKEAGYKLMKQLDEDCAFVPSRFIYDDAGQSVSFNGHRFPLQFIRNRRYIYCRAHEGDGEVIEAIGDIGPLLAGASVSSLWSDEEEPAISLADDSIAVRVLAKTRLAERLGVTPAKVVIRKSSSGAPQAWVAGELVSATMSFSHHGGFAAVAIGLANS